MIPRQPHILQVPTPAEPGQDLEDEEISKLLPLIPERFFFGKQNMKTQRNIYLKQLNKRVIIFDGAMGTSLQAFHLTAENFGETPAG